MAKSRDELIEQGRRLASERENLIAAGYDPTTLKAPIHPDDLDRFPKTGDDE